MIDCHCHLDSFVRNGELAEILARADAAGVTQMVATGTKPSDWKIYRDLAEAFPQKIFYTVGVHPTELDDDFDAQLDALEKFIAAETAFPPVAVGEIGLDEHFLPKDDPAAAERECARQAAGLSRQLEIAKRAGLPIVIHSRDAFKKCVALIDASGADWRRVDFHCFSEDEAEVRELNSRGARASFTGTFTYKNAENVRRAARAQGLSRLMLETDCPYLAPQGLRGKRNEPSFLRVTAEFAAKFFDVPVEEVDRVSVRNTREFFSL